MNNDVIAISDFYKTKINPSFILQESFSDLYKNNAIYELQEWYEYDLQCLNELLVQEGLGDALKSVGQKIGGAVKGAGDFAMKKLATALGKILKMAMPSEEEAQKLEQEIQKLQSDKGYLDQQAAAGQKLLGTGGNEAAEEVYESTKEFLLTTVFSEANLREFFKQSLLTEAKAGRPKGGKTGGKAAKAPAKGAKPSKNVPVAAGGFQKNSVKGLDTHINELVKLINAMKGGQKKLALNRIARSVGKQTKLEFPQPFPRAQKQAGQVAPQGSGQQAGQPQSNNQLAFKAKNELAAQDGGKAGGQLASQDYSYDTETGQPQLGQGKQQGRTPKPDTIVDAEYTDVSNKALPAPKQETKGLFQKIMGYVKAHPRITSSVALALIAAATVASGGTLLPLVVSGLTTGGVKAGVAAYQSNKQGGKVNWDKTVDALFTGTAQGAGLAAVGQAAKGLMGAFGDADTSGTHDGGLGAKDAAEAQADAETNAAQYDKTHDGGLGAKDAAEAQADAETNAAQYSSQVDNNTFKKFNASNFNPKSPLDQAKKALMQKLSDTNSGNIPSDKYNSLAKQAATLVSRGVKPNDVVRQLMGESYTVKYLGYF
jgi:hypothetical protein